MLGTPRKPTVGLVGLGNLGQAMALRLLDQGWSVSALDLSDRRTAPVVEAGATAVAVEDLAACDVVAFVVPDERAIWDVLEGPEAVLKKLDSSQTIIVHSTLLPSKMQELAERAQQEQGVAVIDAPVTGGAARARAGDLTVFLGGEASVISPMKPLLDSIGSTVRHLGPIGAGSAAKLGNQLVMFAALAGLDEALQLADSYGVSEGPFLEAISTGTADTWVGRNWGFFDRTARDYDAAGVALVDRPWSKDFREVLEASRGSGLKLPLAELLSERVADAIEEHAHEHGREHEKGDSR
jgi:3-hydroxyisobutyrate dehydrogenase-like beta-hydroxyacid dehydrogenase